MAGEILSMLSDDAHQVIESQLVEYSWIDLAGPDEEMVGMTILALVLHCLCPHHKADMYAEIGIIKTISIAQYDNDIHLYFDTIASNKLAMDRKHSTAYTDNSFVRDIFQQLKHESLPSDFRSEFASLERRWQMDKEKVTSQSLMADASSYYTNLVASGNQKLEANKYAQIIALTMQILDLKHAMSQVKTFTKPSGDAVNPLNETHSKNDFFQKWCLTKVENGNKFNMVEKDGTKLWWCDKHKHPDSKQSRMCVFHKLTELDAWKQRKNECNKRKGKGKSNAEVNSPAGPSSTTPVALTVSASKLSLAKSLQEAITTMAGLSKDQYNKFGPMLVALWETRWPQTQE
jgi:hypothetical protein